MAVLTYLKVQWLHQSPNDPIVLYSELDENRCEVRKVEIFRDGTMGFASAAATFHGTELGSVQVPELDEIAADPQFEPVEIPLAEFEETWRRALRQKITS